MAASRGIYTKTSSGLVAAANTGPTFLSDDASISQILKNTSSASRVILTGTFASYFNLVRNPDLLIAGAITRDANGTATSAPVVWPDGTVGTYTATTVSTAFPGAVDAYTITYGSPVTRTYTQPAITRDPSTGAATNVPAVTVTGGGVTFTVVDNGDGTSTLTATGNASITDNGDGTSTVAGVPVTDNGDGTSTIAA